MEEKDREGQSEEKIPQEKETGEVISETVSDKDSRDAAECIPETEILETVSDTQEKNEEEESSFCDSQNESKSEKSDQGSIGALGDNGSTDAAGTANVNNEKTSKKKTIAVIVAVVVGVIVLAAGLIWALSCHHKEWKEATCTEPRTCVECGKTEGEPLGHEFGDYRVSKEPTCTEDGVGVRKCSRCNKVDTRAIEKLGHDFGEYSVTKKSTCLEKGVETRKCSRCGEEETRELELGDHTPGDWEVTVKPYVDSSGKPVAGEKAIKCTVCGEKLQTETYELSAGEIRDAYIASCWKPTYEDIARDPDAWEGYPVALTGEVMQVSGSSILLEVTNNGRYWTDIVYLVYEPDDGAPRILEDDVLTFYGEMQGIYSYTTVMGASNSVPLMYVKYYG